MAKRKSTKEQTMVYKIWYRNLKIEQRELYCLSPLKLWVRIIILGRDVLDTTLCDKICHWLATCQWFSLVSSTNKTDRYDIAEILMKVGLNTITLTLTQTSVQNLTCNHYTLFLIFACIQWTQYHWWSTCILLIVEGASMVKIISQLNLHQTYKICAYQH
jgi:hypothetical protein